MTRTMMAAAAALMLSAGPALAHFQLAYTPEVNLDRPGAVPMKFFFWHPMENGHAMDMPAPEALVLHYKDERIDLTDQLSPVTFHAAHNDAQGYEAAIPVKRNGDYIVAFTPAPYYEESEDIYIQQITKSLLNKGGIPTGWTEPVGLPTEIVPLNKPTNVLAGSTFSGVLLSNGQPVAGAEIEIEYMAAPPDMETNRPSVPTAGPTAGPLPGGAVVAITDANGVFTFGVPKAGFWGFAALGAGPVTVHEGKELSQDAVLWVRAYDMN